jgi:protein MpaA
VAARVRRLRRLAHSTELNGLSYAELARAWDALARTLGYELARVTRDDGGEPLLCLDLPAACGSAVAVALCAGVHGDEPAAPWALFSAVRDGLLDRSYAYRVWCCSNPTGNARGTRAGSDGTDINRSFSRDGLGATTPEARTIEAHNAGRSFALSLDLHEDFEASGFYCYEPAIDRPGLLAKPVVTAIEDAGFALQEIDSDFDLGYAAEGGAGLCSLAHGCVFPDLAAEVRHFEGLPYSIYMLCTARAHRTMTFEAPRTLGWEARLAVQRVAVVSALRALAETYGIT